MLGKKAVELIVEDDVEAPIVEFDDGTETFHPISTVEIVDVCFAYDFIGRVVNMSCNNPGTVPPMGEELKLFFVFSDEIDRTFHLCLDGLRNRVVFFASP